MIETERTGPHYEAILPASTPESSQQCCLCGIQITLSELLYPVSLNAQTPDTVLTHIKCSVIACGVVHNGGPESWAGRAG